MVYGSRFCNLCSCSWHSFLSLLSFLLITLVFASIGIVPRLYLFCLLLFIINKFGGGGTWVEFPSVMVLFYSQESMCLARDHCQRIISPNLSTFKKKLCLWIIFLIIISITYTEFSFTEQTIAFTCILPHSLTLILVTKL